MSDKILLAIISVFVLVVVSGIVYLFIASSDQDKTASSFMETDEDATAADPKIVSDIPEPDSSADPEAGDRIGTERIETVNPQTACGAFQGRVFDEHGAPVAGAEITLFKSIAAMPLNKRVPVHLNTTTDGSGRYLIDSIPVGPSYVLLAQAEQYAEAEMDGLSVAPEETINVADLMLEAGITLSGMVTTESNLPIAKVNVQVVDVMQQLAEMPEGVYSRTTETDGDGRYSFSCLSQRQYEVTFIAQGYRTLTVTQNYILSGQEEPSRLLNVQLDESGLTISGIVRAVDGRGIAGAEVQALYSKPGNNAHFTATTKTESSGSFVLSGLSEGGYTLLVFTEGFFQSEFKSASAGDIGVEINLLPTGAVEGSLQAAGELPKKYTVQIEKYVASVRVNGKNRISSIRGGPKAEFRYADLLPGTYIFLIKAPGFAQTRSGEIEVRSGETTPGLVVDLFRGGAIEGTVTDRGGKPLAGVKITLMDKTYDPALPFEDFFMVPPEQDKSAETGSNGKFNMNHIRPGTYVVKIEGKSVAKKVVKDVVVMEEETVKLGKIRLSQGGRIRGVAYDADGNPARGSKVTAVSSEAGNRKTVTTDNKGAFEIKALAPGEYIVSITPKDFWAALKYESSTTVFVQENKTAKVEVYTVQAERNRGQQLIKDRQ